MAAYASEHDLAAKSSVARHLAALLEAEFADDAPLCSLRCDAEPYLVPSDSLDPQYLRHLRLTKPLARDNFFGGFVPRSFIASKVITHPLVNAGARAPDGWSQACGEAMRDVVLPGRSVFTHADARCAARELLALGPVRVKDGAGVGGCGQSVISELSQLEERLALIDPQALTTNGLVLEQNLTDVATCSIGEVQVGPWTASYCGVQYLTRNGRGHEVYGGSTLSVVRGGLEQLPAQIKPGPLRIAAEQALVYQREAFRCFPGLIASRCNYDVIQGIDAAARWRSGVLEQSWRIGGASGAEIAALHWLRDNPQRTSVRVSTVEVYGAAVQSPADAVVHFDGLDQHGDRLLKFARIEPDDNI